MPDFPIDPELRIRTSPPVVLRRTTEAVGFIRKMTLSRPGHGWRDLLQTFDAARDEWSAMEAVVHLELLLEAEGLLIEERTAHASPLGKIGFAPPRSKSRNVGHGAVRSGAARKARLCICSLHRIVNADRANSSLDRGDSSQALRRHRARHFMANRRTGRPRA